MGTHVQFLCTFSAERLIEFNSLMTAPNLCLNRIHADMKRRKKGILFPTEMLFLFSSGNRNRYMCFISRQFHYACTY